MADLTRRGFVAGTSVAAMMASHAGIGGAMAAGPTPERKLMRDIHAEFERARRDNPWTLGLTNPKAPLLETPQVRLEGKWPEQLKGSFLRTGPAQHERAGERYSHWFDGDGMVQKYQIGDGKVSHLGRMIETPKYLAEEEAGRFLRPTFATAVDLEAPIRGADDMNVANINMLPFGDELLATWEGGSATSLDPQTLDMRGFKVWSPETKGLPFSAHHKVDPDGTIWNFGTANYAGMLVLYHISAEGKLKKARTHALDPNGMIHDFIVTEKHLIVLVPPFRLEGDRPTFVDGFKWKAGEATVGLVFDKETLSLQRRFELPGEFHFHFGNAWEDVDGSLTFDYCTSRKSVV